MRVARNVAPTRSVLLEARRSLATAREGYELLDRKRQALITFAMETVANAEDAGQSLDQRFAEAYETLGRARMSVGVERLEWAALSTRRDTRADITERSVMGVPVPAVASEVPAFGLAYSLTDTTASVDRAVQEFRDLFAVVCETAELETTVWRLAREIRRTQRRVNALRNILIPRYEGIVSRVEGALEEKEREDFYRAKAVKRTQEHPPPERVTRTGTSREGTEGNRG
jgi:V/A-type H+-transporting ATPase subunit D